MTDLMKFFKARRAAYHTDPKLVDQVIYSPYRYPSSPNSSELRQTAVTGDLLGVPELRQYQSEDDRTTIKKKQSKFSTEPAEAEIFLFEYGTVVIWGMTEAQEKRFLSSMLVIFEHLAICLLFLI
jgi:uncharacterized Rmd1/YagE family protein